MYIVVNKIIYIDLNIIFYNENEENLFEVKSLL